MNQSSIRKNESGLHNGQSTVLKLEDSGSSDESEQVQEQDFESLTEFNEDDKRMRRKQILPLYYDLFTNGDFTKRNYEKMKSKGWFIFTKDFKTYDAFLIGLSNYKSYKKKKSEFIFYKSEVLRLTKSHVAQQTEN